MAQHSVKQREDGRWIFKMDPALRGAVGTVETDEERAEREKANTQALWDALAKVQCPSLVVRGAASDIISADVADRMVEVLGDSSQLAVVPRAGHSVMTDNPKGFNEAVLGFVLGES